MPEFGYSLQQTLQSGKTSCSSCLWIRRDPHSRGLLQTVRVCRNSFGRIQIKDAKVNSYGNILLFSSNLS